MIPGPLSRTVIFLTASALPSSFSLLPLDHCTGNVSARECTWKPTENDGRRIAGFELENVYDYGGSLHISRFTYTPILREELVTHTCTL